jgi:biopolymer transport protein ExbB/TolQ
MNITQQFLAFTLLGAEWVLWLLIGLSVISVAIMIERILYLRKQSFDVDPVLRDARRLAGEKDVDGAKERFARVDHIGAQIAFAGVAEARRGASAAAEAMAEVRSRERQKLDRNLSFLGTLGNNAPFIGLFGTVLGIIKAFNDLASNTQAGAEAVMAGISEALVATAIGLLVAIPAVLAFNFFNRRVRAIVAKADQVAHAILAELRAESDADAAPAKGKVA